MNSSLLDIFVFIIAFFIIIVPSLAWLITGFRCAWKWIDFKIKTKKK